jgi:hypothetical protein
VNNTLRNALAFFAGVIALMVVKILVTRVGNLIVPPPSGADLSSVEGFKASIHLFEAKHFAVPYFEHSLGSLTGAAVAAAAGASHRMKLAVGIGALHLIGGILAAMLIPAPVWFIILDISMAYIPMAYLGGRIAIRR